MKFKKGDKVLFPDWVICNSKEANRIFTVTSTNGFRIYLKGYPERGKTDWVHETNLKKADTEYNQKRLKKLLKVTK